jgi:hypothetical protein
MKRLVLSFVILAGLAVLSVNSIAQVVIQNITYSHASPPYTVTASGVVPPCGASTGSLTVSMLTSSLPAGTVYTIQAQSSLGYNNTVNQTTVSNGQLISKVYAGLAGSPSGVFYTIVIRTPKIPATFNDSTYLAVINLQVISTKNFAASVIPVNPLCPVPPNKGSASVNVSSGTAPYTYSWSVAPNANPGNVPNAPNLDAGSYSVYVVDASGCDTTMPFTLVVQKPTVTLTSNPTGPICNPSFPLSITWTATPGAGWTPNPAGAYSWDGGITFITQNTQTQAGIMTYGTYTKTVIFKDINNCLSTQVGLPVPVDSRPQVTAVASPASVCPGTTTSITATLVPPCSSIGATCSFSYDNGATYGASNMYTTFPINQDTVVIVKVMNSTGCVSNPFPVSIDTSGKPKIVPVVSPSPICPNATYSITSTCTKNCAAVQMNFNNNGLIPGSPQTYNQPTAPLVASTTTFPIFAIGANGCRFDTTVTVVVFTNALTITAPATPICANNNGSTITLTASGFKPASVFTWTSSPAGLPGDGSHATSIIVSSPTAVPISYTLTGVDVNNCPRTTNTNIVVNPQPTATETGPAIHCELTTSTLTAGGGASYQWYDGTFTTLLSPSGNTFGVSPLATTTYGVIATDANGCKDSATFVLNYHARPTGSASASPATICAGNTTDITITAVLPFTPNGSGGYSISDGQGVPPYVGTSASPYTFTGVGPISATTTINTRLKDNFGCESATIPVTITVTPFHYKATPTSPSCSYKTDGSISINNLVGGTSPNVNYSVNGGAYTSFTTSVTIPNLGVNTYAISVKDNSTPACRFDTSIAVASPPVLNIDTISHSNIQCFGGKGTITTHVSGGTSDYDYYLGASNIVINDVFTDFVYTNVSAGTYDVIVVDNNGCRDTVKNVQVIQPAAPISAPNVTTDDACFGTSNGGLSINSASTGGWGGYTYTIGTTPTQSTSVVPFTFANLGPGSYSLSITDSKGCNYNAGSFVVGSFSKIVVDATTVSADCNQLTGSVKVNGATGGVPPYTFTANGLSYTVGTVIPALGPGATVAIHVVCTQGCIADSLITIHNIARSMPIVHLTPPTCPGGNDGYLVFDSVRVKSNSAPPFKFDVFKNASPLTQVGSVTLANAIAKDSIGQLSTGNYIINISDGNGCNNYPVDSFVLFTPPTSFSVVKATYINTQVNSGYANAVITQPSSFTTTSIAMASDISQSTGTVILYNFTGGTPISGTGGTKSYQMSVDNTISFVNKTLKDTLNGQKYISFNNLAPGAHTIYVKDANGCSDTIQIIVPGKFFIPNLVSPNGDSHNDAFEVVSLPDNSSLKILNRWGDRVYSTSNYDNKFDFHGLSDGVYYYDLEFDTGTKFKGWVQVLR